MSKLLLALCAVVLLSCQPTSSPPPVEAAATGAEIAAAVSASHAPEAGIERGAAGGVSSGASLTVENSTARSTTVTIIFGGGSAVTGWPFCTPRDAGSACSFVLESKASKTLPLGGQYLNATLVFDGYKSGSLCGSTKAEFNVNNPSWFDEVDISLVDGYNARVGIYVSPPGDGGVVAVGPPNSRTGNEKVFGVYPLGCDICVARKDPPCGFKSGRDGCKSGKQYAPDGPCQYQGTVSGGGGLYSVKLEE